MDIYILFRDMRTYGFSEDYYREAADKGVKFVRWEPDDKPEVEAAEDEEGQPVLRVTVPDPILGQRLASTPTCVVLSAAVVPSAGSPEVARLFKVAMNPDGFFQEAHVKLRPVDFAADGVFLCGTAPLPQAHLRDDQPGLRRRRPGGHACSPRTRSPPPARSARSRRTTASPAGPASRPAPTARSTGARRPTGKKAEVNPVLCKGDGLCCAKCPTDAIVLKHFTDEEVFNQIDAALSDS